MEEFSIFWWGSGSCGFNVQECPKAHKFESCSLAYASIDRIKCGQYGRYLAPCHHTRPTFFLSTAMPRLAVCAQHIYGVWRAYHARGAGYQLLIEREAWLCAQKSADGDR
jgi:hypothetical protein